MTGELILDEATLKRHFEDARDPVLHAPYRVGDRLLKCAVCGSILRADTLRDGQCPMAGLSAGRHAFSPAPVLDARDGEVIVLGRSSRTRARQSAQPVRPARPVRPAQPVRPARRLSWIRGVLLALCAAALVFALASGRRVGYGRLTLLWRQLRFIWVRGRLGRVPGVMAEGLGEGLRDVLRALASLLETPLPRWFRW